MQNSVAPVTYETQAPLFRTSSYRMFHHRDDPRFDYVQSVETCGLSNAWDLILPIVRSPLPRSQGRTFTVSNWCLACRWCVLARILEVVAIHVARRRPATLPRRWFGDPSVARTRELSLPRRPAHRKKLQMGAGLLRTLVRGSGSSSSGLGEPSLFSLPLRTQVLPVPAFGK